MKAKNIAVIPARGGSKRLPGKNILSLGGVPLIAHSIIYAQENSSIIDGIYVSTDDQEIMDVAVRYGVQVIERPAAISGDLEPTVSAVQHVLAEVDNVDNVILLQPTNPFRPKGLLSQAWQLFSESGRDSLFTVGRNHQKFGKIADGRFVPFNYEIGQRSQDLDPLYFENGLLYLSTSSLIRSGKIISDRAFPLIVDHIYGNIDIDTREDFKYAEWLLKQQND